MLLRRADGGNDLGRMPAFPQGGFILMSQKNPESQPRPADA